MSAKVFILESTHLDTSHAAEFGEVMYIFEKDTRRASIWSVEFQEQIITALDAAGFDAEVDYLACAGHLVPIICCLGAMLRAYGKLNVLLYNSVDRCYVKRKL